MSNPAPPIRILPDHRLRHTNSASGLLITRHAKEQFRLLAAAVKNAEESVLITDAELSAPGPRIVFANEAFTRMTGYAEEEILGKSPRVLQGPDTDRATISRLRSDLEAGRPFHGETINYRKDGTPFIIEWRISAVADELGQTTHYIATQRDVTAVRQREKDLRTSEQRFRTVFERAAVGMSMADADGRFLHVNAAFCAFAGRSEEELLSGGGYQSITHPEDRPENAQKLEQLMSGKTDHIVHEKRYLRPDGSIVWVRNSISVARDANGTPLHTIALTEDITERRRAEQAWKQNEERWRLVLAGANDGIWEWQVLTGQVFLSARWKAMRGYAEQEMANHFSSWSGSVHVDDRDRVMQSLTDYMEHRIPQFTCEYRTRRKDGSWLWVLSRGAAVWDEGGRAVRLAGTETDITEQKLLAEHLAYQAHHDPLTGLANRRQFATHIEEALVSAQARQARITVVYLDLDNFKQINDTLGHAVGDQLLCLVAERLKGALQSNELLARMGGDEFLVMSVGNEEMSNTRLLCECLLDCLHAPFAVGGIELFVSATAGAAHYPADGTTSEALLRNADLALCRAKMRQKGSFELHGPTVPVHDAKMLLLSNDLHRALDRGELSLVYQPQFSLPGRELAGFEALLRWSHPERGSVPPATFIPLAEEHGLIVTIGSWVLEEACRQIREWHRAGLPAARVSVNVSAAQFARNDFSRNVARTLADHGLNPSILCLELTESMVLQDLNVAVQTISQLGQLGVSLSLDDFGTGYSSLACLERLKLDELKIDSSFIQRIGPSPGKGTRLVRSIVELAHGLGMTVTAEAVETLPQLDILTGLGCDAVQGFLLGRPMYAATAADILAGCNNAPKERSVGA